MKQTLSTSQQQFTEQDQRTSIRFTISTQSIFSKMANQAKPLTPGKLPEKHETYDFIAPAKYAGKLKHKVVRGAQHLSFVHH